MSLKSNLVRSEGDPEILQSGPSSFSATDRLGRGLGWFSIVLGVAELVAAEPIAKALGMQGKESLLRAYGVREIGSGILSLSVDKQAGLMSRVAGDGLDIVTLMAAMRKDNPKRDNVGAALLMVMGVTMLDMMAAKATTSRHSRSRGEHRDYSDRSGYPRGVGAARDVARLGRVSQSSSPAAAI